MPGGAGPFQNPIDYTRFRSDRRIAINANRFLNGTWFVVNYVWTTKMLGYGSLSNPLSSVVTTKMLGYGALANPLSAVVTTKLLGYAVLAAMPTRPRAWDWPNPLPPRRSISLRTWTDTGPLYFPPPDLPPSRGWQQAERFRAPRAYLAFDPQPIPQDANPFTTAVMALPVRRRGGRGLHDMSPRFPGYGRRARPVLFTVT